jgi:hypothetical protein
MILNKLQATLINRAIERLRIFSDLYGDFETDDILKQLDASFSGAENPAPKNISIIITFDRKDDAQVFSKYWRIRNTLSVKSGAATVELEVIGNLSTAPAEYISYIFECAMTLNDFESDVNEHVLHARYLLDLGATINDIRTRA